jgi:outer membrane lipoprotein SlyB
MGNHYPGIKKSNKGEIIMLQGGSLWGGLISGGMTQLQDTISLTKGQMDNKNYMVHTSGNLTGALGVMAGIEYGAILGTSLLPGVGTVLGSVVGGLLGNSVGQAVGMQAGNSLLNNGLISNITQFTSKVTESITSPVADAKQPTTSHE